MRLLGLPSLAARHCPVKSRLRRKPRWPSVLAPAVSLRFRTCRRHHHRVSSRCRMPSRSIWRSIGPARGSIPPKKMASGLGLDGSQNGHEVCSLVGGELLLTTFMPLAAAVLLEHAQRLGRMQHGCPRWRAQLQGVSSIESQTSAQCVVVGNLYGRWSCNRAWSGWVGGRAGDARNAELL